MKVLVIYEKWSRKLMTLDFILITFIYDKKNYFYNRGNFLQKLFKNSCKKCSEKESSVRKYPYIRTIFFFGRSFLRYWTSIVDIYLYIRQLYNWIFRWRIKNNLKYLCYIEVNMGYKWTHASLYKFSIFRVSRRNSIFYILIILNDCISLNLQH